MLILNIFFFILSYPLVNNIFFSICIRATEIASAMRPAPIFGLAAPHFRIDNYGFWRGFYLICCGFDYVFLAKYNIFYQVNYVSFLVL